MNELLCPNCQHLLKRTTQTKDYQHLICENCKGHQRPYLFSCEKPINPGKPIKKGIHCRLYK